MLRMMFVLCVVTVGIVALTGCQKNPISAEYEATETYPRVTLSDKSIAKQIGLGDPIVRRNPVGLLKISQPIRERKGKSVEIQYRFIWMDESGAPIDPRMAWRRHRLEKGQPDYLTAEATSEAVIDWKLEIRRALP